MSYSYDSLTGQLVCDRCGTADETVRKHRCPWGYCLPSALCETCWETPAIRQREKDSHVDCKAKSEAYERRETERLEMLDAGKRIRAAALSIDQGRIHVIFQTKNGHVGAYMSPETYHAFPYGENHTWEDYETVEGRPLVAAPSKFQYK